MVPMRYEKVLVTGGNGRLGRHIVQQLEGRCQVTILDLQPGPADQETRQVDILDHAGLADVMRGQEAVIHLAGFDDGDAPSERDYFATNVQGAFNVFQAADDAGVRAVVAASSTAAYGLGYDRAPLRLPIDEAHPLATTGSYGLSNRPSSFWGVTSWRAAACG